VPPTTTKTAHSSAQNRRQPLLTVVIVNYNGWDDVKRLVGVLAESPEVRSGQIDLVIVDNASDTSIPREFTAARPGVRLILRGKNGGFAAGVNAGWRASQSPWLLVLNPDVVPEPELLGQVLTRLGRFPTGRKAPGIVGFGLRNADGSRQPSVGAFPTLVRSVWEQLIPRSRRKYQAGWRTRSGPVPWVTGACVLLNGEMLRDVGGMDEDFFLYYEEVALCLSARRRGWAVEYDPSIEVVHLHPLQSRGVSPAMRVITRHSKLLYFRKHLPRWQFKGLAAIVAAEAGVRGSWSRIRGHAADARAWSAITYVTRALREGAELRGPAIRRLAEAVASPQPRHSGDSRIDWADHSRGALASAGARLGRLGDRGQLLRKDGPA
jgi:N-acetylglucosaminyl-diphospho-decaprenol L-rhamnosyltransferase